MKPKDSLSDIHSLDELKLFLEAETKLRKTFLIRSLKQDNWLKEGLKLDRVAPLMTDPPPLCPKKKIPCARIINWPPSEKTKSRQSPEFVPSKLTRVGDSASFWWWQVLDSYFLGVASLGLCFFSGFWHIGKFGGGKKDQTPCTTEWSP